MSNAANRVVKNLDADIEENSAINDNVTPGVAPAKFYDRFSIVKDEDTGKFSQSVSREETNVNDVIVENNNLIQEAQIKIIDYIDLARPVDLSILENLNLINQKKQEIENIMSQQCGGGHGVGVCSCVVGAAITNGVRVGYSTNIQNDLVEISRYGNLSNFSSDEPFRNDSTTELTSGNAGTGYQTSALQENYITSDEEKVFNEDGIEPIGIGSYRQFNGLDVNDISSSVCAGAAASISTLHAEIGVLRQKITDVDSLRVKVNQIKDKKTEQETILWSLRHDEKSAEDLILSDKSLRNTIITEPTFGYEAES